MAEPIIPNLPSTTQGFYNKYTNPQVQALLPLLPDYARNSLINFDLSRTQRGQSVLSLDQTASILQSVLTDRPATEPQDRSFWQRTVGDLQALVSTIPHLPVALYNEAKQLPKLPEQFSEALQSGGFREQISALSNLPGVRLIPGTYTVGQVAREGLSGLSEHPLFTALDVLPYAKGPTGRLVESAASKLPSVQAARELGRSFGGLPTESTSAARLALREAPSIQALRSTRPVQLISQAVGPTARDLMQLANTQVSRVRNVFNPDANPINLTPDEALLRQAVKEITPFSQTIPQARRTELTRSMELSDSPMLQSLTDPHELAFVETTRKWSDQIGQVGLAKDWLDKIGGEYFTTEQARRINVARNTVAKYESLVNARSIPAEAATNPAVIDSLTSDTIRNPALTRKEALNVAEGYAHALNAAGFDGNQLLTTVRYARHRRSVPVSAVTDQLDQLLANRPAIIAVGQNELIKLLSPYSHDPGAARVLAPLRKGQFKAALDQYKTTLGSRVRTVQSHDVILDSLDRLAKQERYLKATVEYTPRKLDTKRTQAERIEARIAPARFTPLIERKVQTKLESLYANDAKSLALITHGLYGMDPTLAAEAAKLTNEFTRTWQSMKSAGLDPVFIHRVSPDIASRINSPAISDRLTLPSQVKARTGDAAPYYQDASVAVSHQALEYLQRMGSEAFVNEMLRTFGREAGDIVDDYLTAGTRASARNPAVSTSGAARSLIKRDWVKYDPNAIFGPSAPKLSLFEGAEDLWIPKNIADNLTRLFHDHSYRLTGLIDAPLKVFRTALLPLSPRWHIYNLFGGATLLTAETGPGAFRFARRAWEMAKTGELHNIPGMPPGGLGSVPRDVIQWNKTATLTDRISAIHSYKAGMTMRKLWDQAAPGRAALSKGVEKLYSANGFIDDWYRSMAYLYQSDKALMKGLSKTEAEAAGISTVRKVMQQWDRITPIERNVMRYIFPFYGWMNHILRYAYRYPMDHPFRTAVTASFARNELNDLGALPTRFLDSLFLGPPDANGIASTLNLAGVNPFRDVANYFTLAGFTGNLNPIISTTLQTLGIDPGKGTQDLYPELRYDPQTGKLVADNPGFIGTLIGNIIPQTRIITGMYQSNSEFRQILRTNPEAAMSILRSNAGLPVIFRHVDVPAEIAKAELARQEAEGMARNEALKSGDYSKAMSFPGLQPFFEQLQALQADPRFAELLAPFTPTQQSPSPLEAAQTALLRMNAP